MGMAQGVWAALLVWALATGRSRTQPASSIFEDLRCGLRGVDSSGPAVPEGTIVTMYCSLTDFRNAELQWIFPPSAALASTGGPVVRVRWRGRGASRPSSPWP